MSFLCLPDAVVAVDPADKDPAANGDSLTAPTYVYSLSSTSACLTSESPVCCADMVKMFEDRSKEFAFLSEVSSSKLASCMLGYVCTAI